MLSLIIIIGLFISYLPQHHRIISSKSSQGISPWFLLLGSTSSTSSLINVLTLQWGVVRCCKFLSLGRCTESLLGIVQVFLQWACFNVILILSLIYFPPDEKYVRVVPVEASDRSRSPFDLATSYSSQFLSRFFLKKKHRRRNPVNKPGSSSQRPTPAELAQSSTIKPLSSSSRPSQESLSSLSNSSETTSLTSGASSDSSSSFDPSNVLPPSATRFTPLTLSKEYTISLVLAFVVFIHFIFSAFITLCILLLLPKATIGEPSGTPPSHSGQHPTVQLLRIWATCSGILSMILAGCQYIPQIIETLRLKLVGSLSIPMMIIQTPGSFIFVYSLAIRPGFNWTTWIVYFVTGILQGLLLVLCVLWKVRQQALGIDDWGRPLASSTSTIKRSRDGGLEPEGGFEAEDRLIGTHDSRFDPAHSERSPLLKSIRSQSSSSHHYSTRDPPRRTTKPSSQPTTRTLPPTLHPPS